jgi:dynein heavy chain
MHEGNRVYRDKLIEEKDMELYDKIQKDMTSKFFEVYFMMF